MTSSTDLTGHSRTSAGRPRSGTPFLHPGGPSLHVGIAAGRFRRQRLERCRYAAAPCAAANGARQRHELRCADRDFAPTGRREMNKLKVMALAVLTVPLIVFGANTPPVVKAPKERCSNIEWSTAFLKEYPTAPAACRSVMVK